MIRDYAGPPTAAPLQRNCCWASTSLLMLQTLVLSREIAAPGIRCASAVLRPAGRGGQIAWWYRPGRLPGSKHRGAAGLRPGARASCCQIKYFMPCCWPGRPACSSPAPGAQRLPTSSASSPSIPGVRGRGLLVRGHRARPVRQRRRDRLQPVRPSSPGGDPGWTSGSTTTTAGSLGAVRPGHRGILGQNETRAGPTSSASPRPTSRCALREELGLLEVGHAGGCLLMVFRGLRDRAGHPGGFGSCWPSGW